MVEHLTRKEKRDHFKKQENMSQRHTQADAKNIGDRVPDQITDISDSPHALSFKYREDIGDAVSD